MQVKLKQQVTMDDLLKLDAILADLTRLTVGLNPSAPASYSLNAAIWTVRACGQEWSQDPYRYIANPFPGRGPNA